MKALFSSDAQALVNEQGQKVIIPEIYTSIADQAFYGLQLTSVDIPGSISTIGQYAFFANQLENIVIADGVKSIGYLAFGSNQLTSVDVPDSVTTISDYAFYENQLTSIEIPNSVTSLGGGAFSFNQLSSVDIPESLSSILSQVFFGNQLTNIAIPNGVSEIGDRAFGNNQLTSVHIPESVRKIGAAAFLENKLTSIVLPTNLTEIKQNAFRNNQLTSVEIPDSVVEIGIDAFLVNPLERISISEDASFDLSVYEDAGVEIIFRTPTVLANSTIEFGEDIIGGSVVASFNTTNADTNDTFTYALIAGEGDTDNGEFSIEGDELTIQTSPDYETKNSYSIRVRTTDSEGLFFEKVFTLIVNDVQETLLARDNANTLVNDQGIDVIIPDRYEAIKDNNSPPEPDSPVLTINPEEFDNGRSVVINPESIPQGDETLVISSSNLPKDTQPIFELSGGIDSTVNLSIDFQKIDESSTPINTNQSTDGGGSIASNAPQNLTLNLDGVYFNSGAGDDYIIGAQFNDFLRAGAGDDIIDAGGGNDIVRAGAGSDRITLGSGSDTLYLTTDQLDGSTDVLTDFNSAEDRIVLSENLTVSLADNIATFTTEIDDVERSTQLIFSGFDTLSEQWFSFG